MYKGSNMYMKAAVSFVNRWRLYAPRAKTQKRRSKKRKQTSFIWQSIPMSLLTYFFDVCAKDDFWFMKCGENIWMFLKEAIRGMILGLISGNVCNVDFINSGSKFVCASSGSASKVDLIKSGNSFVHVIPRGLALALFILATIILKPSLI